MRVLVVAAHPDDEVLGCGGTISSHICSGDEVYVLILGEGASSRYSKRRSSAAQQAVRRLRRQAGNAAKILQIKTLWTKALPDNRFDRGDLLEIVRHVEQAVKRCGPAVIYTHFWGDLNIDHRLTCQAVVTACRPSADCPVGCIYSFEVPSSTDWNFCTRDGGFQPNYFVPIDEGDLETKLSAMRCYVDEVRQVPHPRSPEVVETLARLRGAQIGRPLAEAFMLIREVKI